MDELAWNASGETGDDVKGGANQSPRRSKKQRSDQWHDEMKRIRSRAEQ
jgi:hypothetical protein